MRFLRQVLFSIVGVAFVAMAGNALAEGIKTRQAQIEASDSAWVVNASFQIELAPELDDAVKKGITFHFVTEFNVSRGRWYWFDEKPVQALKNIKLSYQPVTQTYRVSSGGLTLSATTLHEALIQLGSIGAWQVSELGVLDGSKPYQAEIRMRLDLSQLPKPFQINAINAREWNLSSDWFRFSFTPPPKINSAK